MGETATEKKARMKKFEAARNIWRKTVEDARNTMIEECPEAHIIPFLLGREHTSKEIEAWNLSIKKIKVARKLLKESFERIRNICPNCHQPRDFFKSHPGSLQCFIEARWQRLRDMRDAGVSCFPDKKDKNETQNVSGGAKKG